MPLCLVICVSFAPLEIVSPIVNFDVDANIHYF